MFTHSSLIKAKIKASAFHSLVTLSIASLTAILVYSLWYPGKLSDMLGGTELYGLILLIEIVLGPLMSIIIFNPAKPRSELIRDYCFIGAIQTAALVYGLYVVSAARPAYIIFVKDRFEVVTATELDAKDLENGAKGFNTLPRFGPKTICTESPTDPQEKSDLLFSAIGGKDIQLFPKYYRTCQDGEILGKAYKKEQLSHMTDIALTALPKDLQHLEFTWLPVMTRFDQWIAVYTSQHPEKAIFLQLDPFKKNIANSHP